MAACKEFGSVEGYFIDLETCHQSPFVRMKARLAGRGQGRDRGPPHHAGCLEREKVQGARATGP